MANKIKCAVCLDTFDDEEIVYNDFLGQDVCTDCDEEAQKEEHREDDDEEDEEDDDEETRRNDDDD